jgi:hypothetical protein
MVILLPGLCAAAMLLYLLLIVPTQWLKLRQIHHPCGLGIRVLQISDLHMERLRIGRGRLQRLILKEKPDYIALTGDFTMRPRCVPKAGRYAEAICSAGIPVFAVLGNHDHRLPKADLNRLVQTLEHAGVKVLINESFETNGIQWVGIDDYTSKKSNVRRAFRRANPRQPCLVLTHTPELVLHLNRKYTYLMAGHLHGKQFNLPYLFRIINKGKLAASGIYKGLHHGHDGPFYISAGIGQAGLNVRLLIRSEVTLHHL